jgi:histidyl-tRNA synthetase
MKKADASGARFAVIIGDEEAQAGEISIKPLRQAAEQVRVAFAEAADLLKGSGDRVLDRETRNGSL